MEVFATGESYAAKGFLYPDAKVKLLKAAAICPYAMISTRGRIAHLRNQAIHKKAIGTTLSCDVWLDGHSKPAPVLSDTMRNGNELCKAIDSIPLGEYMEVEGFEPSALGQDAPKLTEGKVAEAVQDRYERNKIARRLCIGHHGAKCAICGFDFMEAYGDEFEGIIQVHPIVPIGGIGGERNTPHRRFDACVPELPFCFPFKRRRCMHPR